MKKCKTIGCNNFVVSDGQDFCPECATEFEQLGVPLSQQHTGSARPTESQKDVNPEKYNHYFKDVSGLIVIDVYRVIELFQVPAGAIDHALKKLLCSGQRGNKEQEQDIQEAYDSLGRWLEMRREDRTFGRV